MVEESNLFEEATRKKFRFPCPPDVTPDDRRSGALLIVDLASIPLEQVWELSLKQLNEVYKKLTVQYKTAPDASLLGDHEATAETISKKLQIVSHIFEVKRAEEGEKQ